MKTLKVSLDDRSYPIWIGSGVNRLQSCWQEALAPGRVALVTNDRVGPLYAEAIAQQLREWKFSVVVIQLPDGEQTKDWQHLNLIFDQLMAHRFERGETLVALGGGVVGDMAGFAAACYQRGMRFVQVPTTLLAQVDSSVGGKTAINHPLGKNMIGAFYQPRVVIADTDTLKTLPERELAAGLAEIIKYGLIGDIGFFEWLEANMDRLVARDPAALTHAIQVSCHNKATVVAADEREEGVRALLNFGHTFGHAIESGLGYGKWLHGEAVAAGMVIAARVSQRMGLVDEACVTRTVKLLLRAGLPVLGPRLGVERYLELMGHDKKVEGGKIRFVLLKKIGEAFVSAAVPGEALAAVLGKEGVNDA